MVVQAPHHQGGRDQLVENPKSRHLHCQRLKHLPRLLRPCLEGSPFEFEVLKIDHHIVNSGGHCTSEWSAEKQWPTEFGGAGENRFQIIFGSNWYLSWWPANALKSNLEQNLFPFPSKNWQNHVSNKISF